MTGAVDGGDAVLLGMEAATGISAPTCLNCIHYVESRHECSEWERHVLVQDPSVTASRCRRYTDLYGREVEFVEGKAQFKRAADAMQKIAEEVAKAAAAAHREVDAILRDAKAAQAQSQRAPAEAAATRKRPYRPRALRRPDVSDERIRELLKQGKSANAIAREVGMDKRAVRGRLRRLGLVPTASAPRVTVVQGSAAPARVVTAIAAPGAAGSEVVITATTRAIAVDVRVPAGATLSDLLDVLKAIGGVYPAGWRVQPVAFQVMRDAADR